MPPPYDYASTQVNFPPDSPAAKHMELLRAGIDEEHLAASGFEDEPHVTVRYGLIDGTDAVKKYLGSQNPFSFVLGKTKSFPPSKQSDGASPIYVEVISPELERIHDGLQDVGNFKTADFEYHPHATLAYVQQEQASRYEGLDHADGVIHTVNSIVISHKNGTHEEVPLLGQKMSVQRRASRMITKTLKFEVSDVQLDSEKNEGVFTGFASAWTKDSDEEVIDKGAFRRTLGISGGKVPILWQHSKTDPCGYNVTGQESERGLSVEGRLALGMTRGKDAYEWLKLVQEIGGRAGLSIGFRATQNGTYVKDGIRHFKEVELLEYSIVTFPANQDAYVTGVKEEKEEPQMDVATIVKALRGESVELTNEQKAEVAALQVVIAKHVKTEALKLAGHDFIAKDDMADDEDGGEDPGSFENAMSDQRAEHEMSDDHRYRIEKAFDKTISGIRGSGMAVSQKKAKITAACHGYAGALSDWHHKALDAECAPMKNADGSDVETKSDQQQNAAKLTRKLRRARSAMKDGHAMIRTGQDRIEKGYQLLHDVSRNYYAYDLNVVHPVGGGKSATEDDVQSKQHTTDPDIRHSVHTEVDLTSLFSSLQL